MIYNYHIQGMHCVSCIDKIKSALSQKYQIVQVTLNPPQLQIEADSQPNLENLNHDIAVAGKYEAHPISNNTSAIENKTSFLSTYYPIFLITAYIFGIAMLNSASSQGIDWHKWMSQFMAGFFIVFSGFKFLDLSGFAAGYATYDLLAKRWYFYGYIYPFLELSLGVLYITGMFPTFTSVATIVIMGFSSIGVINSLLKKQQIQCACLGTALKVPLSKITLVEDLTMVVMAVFMLLI